MPTEQSLLIERFLSGFNGGTLRCNYRYQLRAEFFEALSYIYMDRLAVKHYFVNTQKPEFNRLNLMYDKINEFEHIITFCGIRLREASMLQLFIEHELPL